MDNNVQKYLVWVIIAIIFSLGLFSSAFVVVNGLKGIKKGEKIITVTGSAKKPLKSDLIDWKGSFSAQAAKLSDAYDKLSKDLIKVKNYLLKNGVQEKDLIVSAITTTPLYSLGPNGQYTNKIDGYRLTQEIEIRSNEVEKITNISRQITSLINEGVEFQSMPPQYIYTKIADLKVEMLALATRDAKNRAEQIALNAGTKIKSLKSARMGVFQITPLYSTEVSDYGIYDTSSIDKEITGVVNCEFIVE